MATQTSINYMAGRVPPHVEVWDVPWIKEGGRKSPYPKYTSSHFLTHTERSQVRSCHSKMHASFFESEEASLPPFLYSVASIFPMSV